MCNWNEIKNNCMAYFTNPEKFGKYSPNEETHKIMQFTGLKDKNGKDIYEGDILKINNSNQVVEFYKSSFVTMYIQRDENGCMEWRKDLSQQYKPEIIGNIHESPELLNQLKEGTK